jgi:hypothetical protein
MDRANASAHLTRAKTHEDCARALAATGSHEGWPIVINFYAALHIVDAYLNTKTPPLQPDTHSERFKTMNTVSELHGPKARNFRAAYQRLYNVGHEVRYGVGYEVVLSRQKLQI